MDVLRICFLAAAPRVSLSLSLSRLFFVAFSDLASLGGGGDDYANVDDRPSVRVPVRQSRIKLFFSMKILTVGEVAGSTRLQKRVFFLWCLVTVFKFLATMLNHALNLAP